MALLLLPMAGSGVPELPVRTTDFDTVATLVHLGWRFT
jgi:hypothetical protein